jgi:hypothetical protein
MRRRIAIREHGILRCRHNLAIDDEKGAEGMVPSRSRLAGQRDALSEKPFVDVVHQN